MKINRILKYIGDRNNQYKDYIKGEIDDNNLRQGYWEKEDFYIKESGYYVNGKKNGEWVSIWSDGTLYTKEYFLNGILNGYYEFYIPNGTISHKGYFVDGIQNDLWEYYYDNGQLKKKGCYVNGREVGKWEYYNVNGKLIRIEEY